MCYSLHTGSHSYLKWNYYNIEISTWMFKKFIWNNFTFGNTASISQEIQSQSEQVIMRIPVIIWSDATFMETVDGREARREIIQQTEIQFEY